MQPELAPPLGGKPLAHLPADQRVALQRQHFERYLTLFNARRYDAFPAFYSDSIEYVMDGDKGQVYHGPAAIKGLYQTLHSYFDEHVQLENIAFAERMIALEARAFLRARRSFDLEGFIPIPEGQVLDMTSFNHYDLDEEGKVCRIRLGFQSMRYVPDDGSFFPLAG